MKPVMHPASERTLQALFNTMPHAVLLTGPSGSGVATVARYFANATSKTILVVLPEKDEKIDTEKGTITVESIRRLYDMTKTIAPKGRIIIIDYAERMGIPAQNAFLKLLEEPPKETHFVLLSHTPESLLPTIRSRSQHVALRPITAEQSLALLDSLGIKDQMKRTQLLFIAQGLPAELTRLVQDEVYFAARAAIVKDAREYITGSAYTRLLLAKKYKESRSDALTLLEDAMKQLEQTIAKGQHENALHALSRLESLHKRITEQGNVRLQLSSVVLL